MNKIMRIGKILIGEIRTSVFIKVEYSDGKFSMSGVVGPTIGGYSRGGYGQICMEFSHRNPEDDDKLTHHLITPEEITFAPGWDREKWLDLLDVRKRWHLNDMRAGCEHQRASGAHKKKLDLIEFGWSAAFHHLREKGGHLTAEEYAEYQSIAAKVLKVTIESPVKWKSPLVEELLAGGWIEEKKHRTQTAGWVYEKEHPEGVLCKPCEVCGYKYGSDWLKEEVPPEVIETVKAWPDADIQPAWI